MRRAAAGPAGARRNGPHTLAVDVGGTHIKASVLDAGGTMVAERRRVDTPQPCPPDALFAAVQHLAAALPPFDRVSVGFPGAVRAGRILTAPHLGTPPWRAYPLVRELSRRLGRPARVLNDAEVQGLGTIAGRGLEVVLTLGTGVGSAIFSEGRLAPHMELGQHPIRKDKTYDDYLGEEERLRIGPKRWNSRVRRAIRIVETLFNFDTLYVGGGNAVHLDFVLPRSVRMALNEAGITGCIRLWDESVWTAVPHGADAREAAPIRRRGAG